MSTVLEDEIISELRYISCRLLGEKLKLPEVDTLVSNTCTLNPSELDEISSSVMRGDEIATVINAIVDTHDTVLTEMLAELVEYGSATFAKESIDSLRARKEEHIQRMKAYEEEIKREIASFVHESPSVSSLISSLEELRNTLSTSLNPTQRAIINRLCKAGRSETVPWKTPDNILIKWFSEIDIDTYVRSAIIENPRRFYNINTNIRSWSRNG